VANSRPGLQPLAVLRHEGSLPEYATTRGTATDGVLVIVDEHGQRLGTLKQWFDSSDDYRVVLMFDGAGILREKQYLRLRDADADGIGRGLIDHITGTLGY
jgi:hypothetical protein